MSLPWFPFNIKDFLANTKRLNTEAKGAYLCLMLDYYEQEAGPPDDDDILASICELSPDAWKRHRKVIAPLFDIKDGFWHHARIEFEIVDGHTKLAAGVARGQAGAAARWSKKSVSNAQAKPQTNPEQSIANALLPKPILSLSAAPEMEPEEVVPDIPLGTPIDPKWQPSDEALIECAADTGSSEQIVSDQIRMFIADHQERGTFSHDWNATWVKWWGRWRAFRDKELAKPAPRQRAPPRVEVNAVPFEPNAEQWERACGLFAKGIRWPKAGYGPDPDSLACKCPHEILLKHGLRKEPVT